jgi:UDP-N-acetylmuramyl pentapeptide phosphotransferase/UDP-N-acetylglucosamine-1-phosphate transferase
MKTQNKKYLLQMTVGGVAYLLGIWALNRFYPETPQHKYWLILLPLLPIIYMTTAFVRVVSEMDEMKRKIVTEALAFSGVATSSTCFSYLFLRDMGAPEFHAQWAFYIAWIYYFIGYFFSWRRYK